MAGQLFDYAYRVVPAGAGSSAVGRATSPAFVRQRATFVSGEAARR